MLTTALFSIIDVLSVTGFGGRDRKIGVEGHQLHIELQANLGFGNKVTFLKYPNNSSNYKFC